MVIINADLGIDKVQNVAVTASGGGTDKIFQLNEKTITSNYTIPTGYNAITAGPVTVSDGVTIIVADGSTWTIV